MFNKKLSEEELKQLQGMLIVINQEKFKEVLVSSNTALVKDGKKYAQQLKDTVVLLERAKNEYIATILGKCGFDQGQKCSIDPVDGVIKIQK